MRRAELNRKMNINIWIVGIALILVVSCILFWLYLKRDKVYNVRYDEKSELNYKVAIKENEYFNESYLNENKQYVTSLIDFITADFMYDLNVKENLEYSYKYRVVADANIIDNNTNKVIYTVSDNLLDEFTGTSKSILQIKENVQIDYNKYNDLIIKFIEGYNLKNVTSNLTVNMYVGIAGTVQDFEKDESVMTLSIPLTTNTVGIDVKYNLSDNLDSLIELKPSYKKSKILLISAVIFLLAGIGLAVGLIRYIKNSLTDEEKYSNELSKIINNYGTYISEVEDEFDMEGYQILKVKSFVDLLEIRDTMHIPIIMIENKENLVTCFMIPTSDRILYFYSLGITQYALPAGTTENMRGKHEQRV